MCGLVGFVPNKKQYVNLLRFKSLLLYNEPRGRMSTGIYNSDGILKETVKASEFTKDKNWNNLNRNSVFMGHTRQPSVGYKVSLDGAQPIEQDNIVMIHNGSIYNKEQLAKKYKVKVDKDDTDSVVMSKILNKKEYGVLEDYNGSAALLWAHKDEPTSLYFYRGESKRYERSTIDSEERPLYGMYTKEGLYFSSLEDSLVNISLDVKEQDSVFEVDANTVFKVDMSEMKAFEEIVKIERKSNQEKVYFTTKSNKKNKNNNHRRPHNYYMWDEEDWNDFYDTSGNKPKKEEKKEEKKETKDLSDKVKGAKSLKAKNTKKEEIYMGKTTTLTLLATSGKDADQMLCLSINDHDILEESFNPTLIGKNNIVFNKGRYWYISKDEVTKMVTVRCADGRFIINQGKPNQEYVYFLRGILLKYELAHEMEKVREQIKGKSFGEYDFADIIGNYADQPVAYYSPKYTCTMFMKDEDDNFDGRYKPRFINRGIYIFSWGFQVYGGNQANATTVRAGDMVKFKQIDEIHEVLEAGTTGVWIKKSDGVTRTFFTYNDITDITFIEDDEPFADFEDETDDEEDDGFLSICIELEDDLNSYVERLKPFEKDEMAKALIEQINKFKENNIVI